MNWNRELEPPMTLERAETLLSKVRHNHPGLSDLAIARRIHDGCSNAIISCAFCMSSIVGHTQREQSWYWALIPLFGLVLHQGIQRSRFSRIRQLFEASTPQSLAELADQNSSTLSP